MTDKSKPVWQRLTSCLEAKTFALSSFRGLMITTVIGFTLVENALYILLKQSIQVGELPSYSANLGLIILSVVELLIGPYVSWMGYKNRRNMMLLWMLVAGVATALLWLLPDIQTSLTEVEGTCTIRDKFIPIGTTSKSIIRFLIILVVGCTYCLARVAVFSHAIAYLAEQSLRKFSLQIGVFIHYRVLLLIMGRLMIKDFVENHLAYLLLFFVIVMLINVLQILRCPRATPVSTALLDKEHVVGQGFFVSIGRVLRNKLLMSQMFAMAFLVAAMFGIMYNSNDITKSQYLMVDPEDGSMIFALVMRYKLIFFGLMYYGCLHSEPLMASFNKIKSIKTATLMNIATFVLYVLLALFRCEKGNVVGLVDQEYIQPQCSVSCECIQPWIKFSPICVLDEMTTYLSPCHAGCTTSEDINGAKFFSNCTCAENNGRTTIGACSDSYCSSTFELFKILQLTALVYSVVVIQMQWTTVLQCCEPRDRSVSFGVASAVTSLIAFVIMHVIYKVIDVNTCLWSEGGICHLHNSTFPNAVIFTSATLALMSLVIAITTIVVLKRKQKREGRTETQIESE